MKRPGFDLISVKFDLGIDLGAWRRRQGRCGGREPHRGRLPGARLPHDLGGPPGTPDEDGAEPVEYLIPKGRHLSVQEGDRIEKGEFLLDGHPAPHDILAIKGVEKVVQLADAVAVIASGYWPALKGLRALSPKFGDAGKGAVTSATAAGDQGIAIGMLKYSVVEKGLPVTVEGRAPGRCGR